MRKSAMLVLLGSIWKHETTLLLMFLAVSGCRLVGQDDLGVAPARKSDTFAVDEKGKKFRVQRGEIRISNFKIAGVDLTLDEEILAQAARILGKVETTATGDAADSDRRACYRPLDEHDKTRLYFHRGEVSPWFVLSSGTPDTERNDFCRRSARITPNIATASGLHLGQTQEQVIAVLGLPTRRSHNALNHRDVMAYEFETKKKASPLELSRARERNPGMNEQELQNNYGFYDLDETISAKFDNNSLTELTVIWTATT